MFASCKSISNQFLSLLFHLCWCVRLLSFCFTSWPSSIFFSKLCDLYSVASSSWLAWMLQFSECFWTQSAERRSFRFLVQPFLCWCLGWCPWSRACARIWTNPLFAYQAETRIPSFPNKTRIKSNQLEETSQSSRPKWSDIQKDQTNQARTK